MRSLLLILVLALVAAAVYWFAIADPDAGRAAAVQRTLEAYEQRDRDEPPALRGLRQMAVALDRNDYAGMCEAAPPNVRTARTANAPSLFGCSRYLDRFAVEHCGEDEFRTDLTPDHDVMYFWSNTSQRVAQCYNGLEDRLQPPGGQYLHRTDGLRLMGDCTETDRRFGCVEVADIAEFVEQELDYETFEDFLSEVAFQHIVNLRPERALQVISFLESRPSSPADLIELIEGLVRQAVEDGLAVRHDRSSTSNAEIYRRYPRLSRWVDENWAELRAELVRAVGSGTPLELPTPPASVFQTGQPLFCEVPIRHTGDFELSLVKVPGRQAVSLIAYLNATQLSENGMLSPEDGPERNRYTGELRQITGIFGDQVLWSAPTVGTGTWVRPDLVGATEAPNAFDMREWAQSASDRELEGAWDIYADWLPPASMDDRRVLSLSANQTRLSVSSVTELSDMIAGLDQACPN